MADLMDPDDLAVGRYLDRSGDDGHLDLTATPAASDSIVGAGEREGARSVHHAGDAHARARWTRPRLTRRPLGSSVGVGSAALGVGGHENTGVEDLDETGSHDHLDGLAGEGGSHPIAEPA